MAVYTCVFLCKGAHMCMHVGVILQEPSTSLQAGRLTGLELTGEVGWPVNSMVLLFLPPQHWDFTLQSF